MNSGVRFAVNDEEKEVEISDTGAAGKIQTSAAGARVKSWVGLEAGTGVAGAGCDFGEAGAPQHGMPQEQQFLQEQPQWQVACATRPTSAAGGCARTNGVPASNRLQTMASVNFIDSTLAWICVSRQTFIVFPLSIFGFDTLKRISSAET